MRSCQYSQAGAKSLCHASLPLVLDWIRQRYVVATLLKTFWLDCASCEPCDMLMKDQVESLGQ